MIFVEEKSVQGKSPESFITFLERKSLLLSEPQTDYSGKWFVQNDIILIIRICWRDLMQNKVQDIHSKRTPYHFRRSCHRLASRIHESRVEKFTSRFPWTIICPFNDGTFLSFLSVLYLININCASSLNVQMKGKCTSEEYLFRFECNNVLGTYSSLISSWYFLLLQFPLNEEMKGKVKLLCSSWNTFSVCPDFL